MVAATVIWPLNGKFFYDAYENYAIAARLTEKDTPIQAANS